MVCTEKLPVPPVLGGAIQTYISGALPYLRKQHEITVLGVNDASLPDNETMDDVHYVRVPGKVFEVYREAVAAYVAKHNFDLIHIFNRPRLVLPIRNAAPEAKITLSMHNDMFKPEKIDPQQAELVVEEVSRIVTVSDYIGDVIRGFYPKADHKISTIYSGVDTTRFLPGTDPEMRSIRSQIRKENQIEDKTVLMFAGRLSRNKGVDKLVLALPELAKKHKDLALVIVGSKWFSQDDVTDYVAYVRALANRLSIPVVTTGFVSPANIQNWYAAADIFVCTSIWQEPLARVHYEAMAAGLPIITTARGGNPEVMEEGKNGFIVHDPENPEHFAEKINQLLSNRSLLKSMGSYGRSLAESKYEWNRVGAQILEAWAQAKQDDVMLGDSSHDEGGVETVETNAEDNDEQQQEQVIEPQMQPQQEESKLNKIVIEHMKEQKMPIMEEQVQTNEMKKETEVQWTLMKNKVEERQKSAHKQAKQPSKLSIASDVNNGKLINIWGEPIDSRSMEAEGDIWGDNVKGNTPVVYDPFETEYSNPFD